MSRFQFELLLLFLKLVMVAVKIAQNSNLRLLYKKKHDSYQNESHMFIYIAITHKNLIVFYCLHLKIFLPFKNKTKRSKLLLTKANLHIYIYLYESNSTRRYG